MSEVGGILTVIALRNAASKKITVTDKNGKTHEIGIDIIENKKRGGKVEDLGVKLVIPSDAVGFTGFKYGVPGSGLAFESEDLTDQVIGVTLAKIGAFATPEAFLVCGHGFSNVGKTNKDLVPVMKGRAKKIAEKAGQIIERQGIKKGKIKIAAGIAHEVDVARPAGGLIIKINGAAADGCTSTDWKGAPL